MSISATVGVFDMACLEDLAIITSTRLALGRLFYASNSVTMRFGI